MDVRIIANPVAGGAGASGIADELLQALRSRGAATELVVTRQRGDARKFAAADGADTIVSVGGDGTAHEIVNGLVGKSTRMAILGVGTANVVARQFGLPRKPGPVADLVLAGKTVRHGPRPSQRRALSSRRGRGARCRDRREGRKWAQTHLQPDPLGRAVDFDHPLLYATRRSGRSSTGKSSPTPLNMPSLATV
jgi:hypothetical protein